MEKLYEAVLTEAKAAIAQDRKSSGVGFSEETHLLIIEAIKLYHCANGLPVPDIDIPPLREPEER